MPYGQTANGVDSVMAGIAHYSKSKGAFLWTRVACGLGDNGVDSIMTGIAHNSKCQGAFL